MTPIHFPEANIKFGPPEDMDESQVMTIPAFVGEYGEGNLDGAKCAVVAWKPSEHDLQRLAGGAAIYLLVMMDGGLPPHCLTTEFPFTQKGDGQ